MVAGLALGASAAGLWHRRRRRPSPPRPVRSVPPVDLADLKAMAQKRREDMQGCRLLICEHRFTESGWLRLLVKVEPPTAQVRWWPWGLSLECPERLARRDSMTEGGVLQLALPKRVEGHGLDSSLHGVHTLAILVRLPSDCLRLEVGYYGRPIVVWDFQAPFRPDP